MQKRSDAKKVLTKIWLQIIGELLVGVKPVYPIQRKSLNEPTQPVTDRIKVALQERLCLLHCCEADFFILGATGDVCPDRMIPCRHILFVLGGRLLSHVNLDVYSTHPHHLKSLLVLMKYWNVTTVRTSDMKSVWYIGKLIMGAPFCASCGNRWDLDYEKEYLNLASYMSEEGMD
ncbi:hypothetical protein MKX01_036331 [Papaver californicum]|nr:hypothetical protein MKX01_036331 [Papaver californicum]